MLLDLPGTPSEADKIVNCKKYLLYNDCFMGLFDNTVGKDEGRNFAEVAYRIEKMPPNDEFG